MKEYTLIYNAEITEIFTSEGIDESAEFDKDNIAAWIESKLNVDDVNVKNVKIFEREEAAKPTRSIFDDLEEE